MGEARKTNGTRIGLDSVAAWKHQPEVEGFFKESDSAAGLRSVLGAQLEGLASGITSTPTFDFDAKVVDLMSSRQRGYRVAWLTLREMQRRGEEKLVIVLHLLFGHVRYPDLLGFGVHAPIAHLTSAAERAREDFVAARTDESMTRLAVAADTLEDQLVDDLDTIAAEFWRTATKHATASALYLRHARSAADPKATVEQQAQRSARAARAEELTAKLWLRLGYWLSHYASVASNPPDILRAQLGAITNEDRATSARDALKHFMGTSRRRDLAEAVCAEAGALRRDALAAYANARDAVLAR